MKKIIIFFFVLFCTNAQLSAQASLPAEFKTPQAYNDYVITNAPYVFVGKVVKYQSYLDETAAYGLRTDAIVYISKVLRGDLKIGTIRMQVDGGDYEMATGDRCFDCGSPNAAAIGIGGDRDSVFYFVKPISSEKIAFYKEESVDNQQAFTPFRADYQSVIRYHPNDYLEGLAKIEILGKISQMYKYLSKYPNMKNLEQYEKKGHGGNFGSGFNAMKPTNKPIIATANRTNRLAVDSILFVQSINRQTHSI